jgi:hypothetical protein
VLVEQVTQLGIKYEHAVHTPDERINELFAQEVQNVLFVHE